MDISTFPIEKRIFHIDNECYIIFLGEDPQDYKPFLRIGNSQNLTQEIISNIYNIVITDSYTGNPFLEPENVNRSAIEENRYVGDKDTIERLRRLIEKFNRDTNRIDIYREIETAHRRAVVYFYDDGNVHLYYDQTLMFDLKNRERKDLHFIEKTERIKDCLSKSPLHYTPDTFRTPGFLLIDHTFLLFNKGHLISHGIPENYFYRMAKFGIDPDSISALLSDEATAPLFYLFKRKQYKKTPIDIITSAVPLMKNVTDLFTMRKTEPLNAKIIDIDSRSETDIHEFTIKKEDNLYSFRHRLIPFPLLLVDEKSIKSNEQIIIDPVNRYLRLPGEDKKQRRVIPEGIPYVLIPDALSEEQLINTYFTEPAHFYSELLRGDEAIVLRHLNELFVTVMNEQRMPSSTPSLKRELKRVGLGSDTALIFPLLNASEICTYLINTGKYKDDKEAILNSIRKEIDGILRSVKSLDIQLPLTCDCYISERKSYLLYRLAKTSMEMNDYLLSRDAFAPVDETADEQHELHAQERERLLQLIDELAEYTTAQRERQPAGHAQEEEAEQKEPVPAGPLHVEEKGDYTKLGIRPRSERKKRGRAVLFIPLGIIIVLGGAFFLFFGDRVGTGLRPKGELIAKRGEDIQEAMPGEEAGAPGAEEEYGMIPGEGIKPDDTAGARTPSEGIQEGRPAAGVGEETETSEIPLPYSDTEAAERPQTSIDIEITLLDVYLLTNRIAVTNGYRELDSVDQVKKDPDWIYPHNLLMLPDGEEYRVVKDDTMWDIAERFIRKNLEQDWKMYVNIMKEIEKNENRGISNKDSIEQLETLRKRSYSENFTRELNRTINSLTNK